MKKYKSKSYHKMASVKGKLAPDHLRGGHRGKGKGMKRKGKSR